MVKGGRGRDDDEDEWQVPRPSVELAPTLRFSSSELLRRAHHSAQLHQTTALLHAHDQQHPQLWTSNNPKMPKFFCDYCDVYLTHDSMSVRKAHNNGRNHLRNVQAYYEQISSDQTQQVINSITDAYNTEGQANPLFQQNLTGGFPGGPMGGMPSMGMGMGMPPMGMPGFPPPGKRRLRPATAV
jgi:hypothetical protein